MILLFSTFFHLPNGKMFKDNKKQNDPTYVSEVWRD